MRTIIIQTCQILLLVSASFASGYGQDDHAARRQFIKEADFSGVVLLAENGQATFQSATGEADREGGIPVSMDTKFRIASITKSVTALLIMQLVEEALVSLDQPLDELLPECSLGAYHEITLHHLLRHTSGLANEPDLTYAEKLTGRAIVNRLLEGQSPAGPTGSFNYNNLDYILLGLIIERFRGQPYETVVQQRILDPLQMEDTGFLERDHLPTGLAKGYVCEEADCREEPDYYIENFYAAGAMYSTAADLLKWDQALYGTELLSESTREIMYRSDPELGYVAYGSWTYNYPFVEGRPFTVERRGGIYGFNSVIIRFPDAQKTLIMLSNTDRFNPDSFGNAEHLKERFIHLLFENE